MSPLDLFQFAVTNARSEFGRPVTQSEEERRRRDELVSRYLTKPIQVLPVSRAGGEDK